MEMTAPAVVILGLITILFELALVGKFWKAGKDLAPTCFILNMPFVTRNDLALANLSDMSYPGLLTHLSTAIEAFFFGLRDLPLMFRLPRTFFSQIFECLVPFFPFGSQLR
jgi:hypothetical protein